MFKHIPNQIVPGKKEQSNTSLLYNLLKKLEPADVFGKGDCIETDFDPRGVQEACARKNELRVIIRQITPNTWRVWRKK